MHILLSRSVLPYKHVFKLWSELYLLHFYKHTPTTALSLF